LVPEILQTAGDVMREATFPFENDRGKIRDGREDWPVNGPSYLSFGPKTLLKPVF
jgi:hypothetical protein